MAGVVIDASVASAWCFPDEQTEYTNSVFSAISSSSVEPVAPNLWAYEIRNSILMAFRRGRINRPDSEQLLASLKGLDIRLVEPAYDDLFALASAHALTIYDAAYLNIAIRENAPLASLDRKLVQAAALCNIPVYQT